MLVYVLTENSDNASPESVHQSLDGAKRAAESLAAPLTNGARREWRQDGAHTWLHEVNGSNDWPLYYIEPFEVRD